MFLLASTRQKPGKWNVMKQNFQTVSNYLP